MQLSLGSTQKCIQFIYIILHYLDQLKIQIKQNILYIPKIPDSCALITFATTEWIQNLLHLSKARHYLEFPSCCVLHILIHNRMSSVDQRINATGKQTPRFGLPAVCRNISTGRIKVFFNVFLIVELMFYSNSTYGAGPKLNKNITIFRFSPCLYVQSITLSEYYNKLILLFEDYNSLTINKVLLLDVTQRTKVTD